MENLIVGKTIKEWTNEFSIIEDLVGLKETFWLNDKLENCEEILKKSKVNMEEILDAAERLGRFASYIQTVFPETRERKGIIESPIAVLDKIKEYLNEEMEQTVKGNIVLKCDSHLPISGSIKARGGIYEVLKLAEDIAFKSGKLTKEDDYSILANPEFIELFSKYSIAVGSTGNLGLSIGIMGAKLGFKTTVHMSADARQWKKDMLRSKGVTVVEYDDDYSKAVEAGRKEAEGNPSCHFVDDENSKTLFLGYTVAALRVKEQFDKQGILVDKEHPLFVYLPCGVGGGPGGVLFGLKSVFGENAHCFFAEPTHSPCMVLGLSTGYHDKVSVQDFGIDNKTAADGLAVGRASSFVGKIVENIVSGSYTLTDERMYKYLTKLKDLENIALEPSALAGFKGIEFLEATEQGKKYTESRGIKSMENATHLVWATGGNMVPQEIMEEYYNKGKKLLNEK
ncbi:MAG: D-serine ammonia-lyase [Fusobacteriaceae bacterium]